MELLILRLESDLRKPSARKMDIWAFGNLSGPPKWVIGYCVVCVCACVRVRLFQSRVSKEEEA